MFGERNAAHGGIHGEMNLFGLQQSFDFRRGDAKNQSRVSVPENRDIGLAISTANKIRACRAASSDDRQIVRFNRNFRVSSVHLFIEILLSVFRFSARIGLFSETGSASFLVKLFLNKPSLARIEVKNP